jgi:penicillin amidase
MSKSSRSTLAIALAVVAVAGGVYFATRSTASGSAGDATDLKIAGLKQTVDVYRDAKGTPHIFARNEDDLFLAYGYVVAEDRWRERPSCSSATTRRSPGP